MVNISRLFQENVVDLFQSTPPLPQQPAAQNVRRSVSRVLSTPSRSRAGAGRPFLWDTRCRVPRATNPGDRSKIPSLPCANAGSRPPLFGLAPGGVYPAAAVTRSAVRFYRTVSPVPLGRGAKVVWFLWHFPWGRPRRPLAGTVFPWSPDFPPPPLRAAAAVQPSDKSAPAPPSAARQQPPVNSAATARARAAVRSSSTPSTRCGANRR